MTDDEDKKKQMPWSTKLLISLVTLAVPGATWLVKDVLSSQAESEKTLIRIEGRLDKMEETNANWGALAELRNDQIEQRVKLAVLEALNNHNRDTILEILRGQVEFDVLPPKEMEELFSRLEELEKARTKRVNVNPERVQMPINADAFRKQMEQRYPQKGH